MNPSEFNTVLGFGVPIFIVFAICSLTVLFVQAYQLEKQEQANMAKRAYIGGLSFAVSTLASVGIAFFAGNFVAALLLAGWFIVTGKAGLAGFGTLGVVLGTILLILLIAVIGIVLGIWPLTVLSIQGYKIVKQRQSFGAKFGTVVFAVFGAVCCVVSILTAFGVTTSIAIELSGKRFGLT